MQQIEQNIYYEDLYLGVTLGALVFPHGTIMIDAPLRTEDARSWRSILINQRGGPNRLLVYLDAHPDRTLGARVLDTTILAHQDTAAVFNNRPMIFKGFSVETGAAWELYGDAIGLRWTPPDITFSDRMSIHWSDVEVILQHKPGPTSGSIWVIIPERNVIFVGDTVFINQPPFLADADIDSWLQSLDELVESYSSYTIVSSRGGIVKMDNIRKSKRFLEKIIKKLDGLERRNAETASVGRLVKPLVADFAPTDELYEHYYTRLYYGLFQNYLRSNRSVGDFDQSEGSGS